MTWPPATHQDVQDQINANITALGTKANTADLAAVATSGAYGDLSGTPTIPSTPADIGAQPAGDYATNTALTTGLSAKEDAAALDGDTAALVGNSASATSSALKTAIDTEIDAKSASAALPPLVVDGNLVREGVGGPRYRATGYNITVVPNIYTAGQTLTAAQVDKYFSQLRPNSLSRLRAYAPPSTSGITWAQQLATLDMVVATARKYGQRIIMCFTDWGSIDTSADAFSPKDANWVTGQVYLNSVSGSNSFEDWVKAVVPRYTADGCVCIYDVCNEPIDAGAANTAAFTTWFETTRNWVQAIDPDALVYVGIDTSPDIGGDTAYQTVNAQMDLCSSHYYSNYGFLNTDTGAVKNARVLGKPLIVDETGVWAKSTYGSTSDTDKDTMGWPAVTFEAQGKMFREQMLRMFALPECMGALVYSYMDSDGGGWSDGLGHYEPINEGLARQVVRSVDVRGDGFGIDTLPGIASWIDGVQALRWAPGAAVTTIAERAITNTFSQGTSNLAATASSWNGNPSLLFAGTQWYNLGTWKVWDPASTYWFAFVPTALPSSGAWGYLMAPQVTTTNGGIGIRINSAGKVELVRDPSTPAAAVVVGTSTNAVNVNGICTAAVVWNTAASASNGTAAGAWQINLNGVATAGTTQASLSPVNGRIGAALDGTNGFVGHWLQGFMERIAETPYNRGKALAYLAQKYTP